MEHEKEDNRDIIENIINQKSKEKDKPNPLEVLGKLFDKNNLETKTDLNIRQIILLNKKRAISKMLGFVELNEVIDDFLLLMISKDRKGRLEFVDAFKGQQEKEINQNRSALDTFKERIGF